MTLQIILEGDRMMTQHLQNLIAIPIFFPDDILLDVVARSGSHENCSYCQMDFILDEIANSLME